MAEVRIDLHSPTWQTVADHAGERIEEARRQLENPGIAERDADVLRGEIKALNRLLGLPKPSPLPATLEDDTSVG